MNNQKENSNEKESQRFSDFLREEDYKEEVNHIKDKAINSQENKSSKNDDTSISHIVEDVNYDYKFGDIYNEMCQILRHSVFVFNVDEDKISINYKNNKNKKYEDLIKDIEKFKSKVTEIIDNFEKFKNFLEKVKNEIKTKIKKRNNFNIELELYEKTENCKPNHKYIDCKFKLNEFNDFEGKSFIYKDILYNIQLENFHNCLDILNDDNTHENERLRLVESNKQNTLRIEKEIEFQNSHEKNLKMIIDNSSHEYEKFLNEHERDERQKKEIHQLEIQAR